MIVSTHKFPNFKRFFGLKTGDLQKKKKKVFVKFGTNFSAEIGNSNTFSAQKQVIFKKKKVFAKFGTDFLAKIGNSDAFSDRITHLRHPNFFGGGCFQFFSKIRPQKHQKRAILKTLQTNKGARTPPPRLRYCIRIKFLISLVCFIFLFTEHAYIRMRISACFFLRLTKNKIRTWYAHFQAFIKKVFCGVTSQDCLV